MPRQKYEYFSKLIDVDEEDLNAILDKLGLEGWLLIVMNTDQVFHHLILIREID